MIESLRQTCDNAAHARSDESWTGRVR